MILISSYSYIDFFRGTKVGRLFEGTVLEGVVLGEPNIEDVSAPNRRIAFSYPFTQAQIDHITFLLNEPGRTNIKSATYLYDSDTLPPDWVPFNSDNWVEPKRP